MLLNLLISLVGCRNATVVDEDGDGIEAAFDCDDSDADIAPGAVEDCTEVDRNCDGDPYAGAPGTLWYGDNDGDGFGADARTREACVAPEGFVAEGGDCNDREAGIHPGAEERCNGIDDNCDGEPDDSPTDQVTIYEDGDGDGFGDDATGATACPGDPGSSLVGGDCDDADPRVAPDQPEICNDGRDDDCDVTTDEDVVAGTPWYLDEDGDQHGVAGTEISACAAPSADYVANAGDCDDLDVTRFPGADETCDPVDQDCDGNPYEGAIDADPWYADVDVDGLGDPTTVVYACEPVAEHVANADDCDDADPAVLGPDPWVVDADEDGFGDLAAEPTLACTAPAGTVPEALALDCDDDEPLVHPDRAEVCNGGVDDDCNPETDEEDTRVWYVDDDGDGYGSAAITDRACTRPDGFVANDDDCDDTVWGFNPDDTPGCVQDHCGTLERDETWRSTLLHTVSCDVKVEGTAKPVLTIQGGALVQFAAGTGLLVGVSDTGRLVVDGAVNEVSFTSAKGSPLPGDWDGLTVGSRDQGSSIAGLLVEYAGDNGFGGIRLNAGNLVLEGVTSRNNVNDGLHVDAGTITVVDSAFTGNTGNGVTIDRSAELARIGLDETWGPSFERNVITANLGRPISLPGSVADEIAPSSTLTGNAVDEIELESGTLRFAGTWEDHGLPYVVVANATIDVQDGPQAVLTIADGVEIVFERSAGLRIGNNEGGRLIVSGLEQGVLMTGSADVIAQSDAWDGLTIGANDNGSELRGLTIEHGGDNHFGNLYLKDASPIIELVVSRYSDADGLAVVGTSAPSVTNSRFVDNDENGVSISSTAGLAFGSRFSGNELTGNGAAPIELPPQTLGALDASSSFAGNGLPIQIHAGTVLSDATWPLLDEIYEITGNLSIEGPQDPVVTIEDGVEMRFAAGTRLWVGTSHDGSLVVDGDELGVVMDSAEPVPATGDWVGVRLGANAGGVPSRLRGVTIAHAGGASTGLGGALELVDPDGCSTQEPAIVLEKLVISDSSKYGLEVGSWVTFSLDDSVLTDNRDGCVYVTRSGTCNGPSVLSYTNNACTVREETPSPTFGTWPIASAELLDATSTYPGPIVFRESRLQEHVRLEQLGVPYHFVSTVTVGAGTGAVLSVASGNTLTFDAGVGLLVGTGDEAGIVFEAGPTPTVLTSVLDIPYPGAWDGIKVGRHTTTVDIQDVVVEYGGDNGRASLWFDQVEDPDGRVDRVTITSSSNCGFYFDPERSVLTVGTVTTDEVCP